MNYLDSIVQDNLEITEDMHVIISNLKLNHINIIKSSDKELLSQFILHVSGMGGKSLKLFSENNSNVFYIPTEASSFPWLNVIENIKYFNRDINAKAIEKIIKAVGLEGYENHFPKNSSLGFRFRIALGRCLTFNNSMILIDSTLDTLDNKTRKEIIMMMIKLIDTFSCTIILGTNSIYNEVKNESIIELFLNS